jgi:hypothetical protein
MKQSQQAFGNEPGVFVYKSKGANAHQHYEEAFEELQSGHGSQHAPLSEMRISVLSVWAHER